MKTVLLSAIVVLSFSCKSRTTDNNLAGNSVASKTIKAKPQKLNEESLDSFRARISKMDAHQLLKESNKTLYDFRTLMFSLKFEIKKTTEVQSANGSFEANAIFSSAEGSFESQSLERIAPRFTVFSGVVINNKAVDDAIHFLQENNRRTTAQSYRELRRSATTHAKNVTSVHQRVALSMDKIKFVLLQVQDGLATPDFADKETKSLLEANILWAQSTSVDAWFRTDTDHIQMRCVDGSFGYTKTVIHDATKGDQECIAWQHNTLNKNEIHSKEFGKWILQRLY